MNLSAKAAQDYLFSNYEVLGKYAVAALIAIFYLKKLFARSDNIPSVQGGIPFFGHVHTMLKGTPWGTMADWMLDYGGIYKFRLFGTDAIAISDPKLLTVVLNSKMSVFKKDLAWTYKPFLVILGNGLVTADGLNWRRQRLLLAHHLRADILSKIPPMAWRAVNRLCVKLDKAQKENRTVEMAEEFRHLTLQVIAEAVLSLSPDESDQTFAHMYLPIVEEGNKRTWHPERMYLPTPAWFKFRKDVATLNNYVTKLIEKRWEVRCAEAAAAQPTSRVQDVLDEIMGAIKPEDWGWDVICQIRDEIKTFILAGHETSASMLAWALYELSLQSGEKMRNTVRLEAKAAYKGLFSETKAHGVEYGDEPVSQDAAVENLKLTECCLRESLRLYSVVPSVTRTCSEDLTLGGKYHISKGSTIMINIQGVHHSPEYWDEPKKYMPERFLKPVKPYTFLPFAEGPRQCLGQFLSLLESKIVLSMLLHKFNFEVVNTEDAGLTHPYMVPIIPKTGHYMKVSLRL